jgi:GntR family transcriptional regulator
MERVRRADRTPVIYERRYVAEKLCAKMTRADAKGSLYGCWTSKCGVTITGADEVIRAVNVSKTQAARLRVDVGTACFEIIATGFITGDRPLWHEQTLYRADVYEFRNRISGLTSSRAALGRFIGQGSG